MKLFKRMIAIGAATLAGLCAACAPAVTEDPSTQTTQQTPSEKREALRASFLADANEVVIGEDSVTFTDASGREEVTIAKHPQSVYNLYASFTTLWYEAGGTVTGCIGGNAAKELYTEYIGRDVTLDEGVNIVSTVANANKWSVETIVAGMPDLIVCSMAMNGYGMISGPAEVAGIPVIAVAYDGFEDYLKWFRVFSALTGCEELWNSVALEALEETLDVLVEIPEGEAPLVFSMFTGGGTSLEANLSTTTLGGMLALMGAVNIADGWANTTGATRLPIDLETVFAADPDRIFVQCHTGMETCQAQVEEMFGQNPVWKALSAVQKGQVHYLDKNLFHNKPNSRFAEAYRTLAKLLYPDTEFSF